MARTLLCLALAAVTCVVNVHAVAYNHTQPRGVVVFLIDDVGAETIQAYGGTTPTPNLDRMEQTGVRMEHFLVNPLCAPTRASLVSGRYPFRHGVDGNLGSIEEEDNLEAKHCLIGNMFKRAGYHTATVLKWSLGTTATMEPCGFDRYALWLTGNTDRFRGSEIQHNILGLEVDKLDDPSAYWRRMHKAEEPQSMILPESVYTPYFALDFFKSFVDRTATWRRPFFFYYPLVLAHKPHIEGLPDDMSATDINEAFRKQVEVADDIIGQVLDHLEEKGLRDQIMVMALSDNGNPQDITAVWGDDNQEIAGGKFNINDRGARVPAFVSWPGTIPSNRVLPGVYDVTDILPTLADAAHADLSWVPMETGEVLDGVSFWPQLIGEKDTSSRTWALSQRKKRFGLRSTKAWLHYDMEFVDVREVYHPSRVTELSECTAELNDDFYNNLLPAISEFACTEGLNKVNLENQPTMITSFRQCEEYKCDGEQLICGKCPAKDFGYRPNREGCRKCGQGCVRCFWARHCKECEQGYGFNNRKKKCFPCSVANCEQCFDHFKQCSKCKPGYALNGNNECVSV